jgi:hypothetical protein
VKVATAINSKPSAPCGRSTNSPATIVWRHGSRTSTTAIAKISAAAAAISNGLPTTVATSSFAARRATATATLLGTVAIEAVMMATIVIETTAIAPADAMWRVKMLVAPIAAVPEAIRLTTTDRALIVPETIVREKTPLRAGCECLVRAISMPQEVAVPRPRRDPTDRRASIADLVVPVLATRRQGQTELLRRQITTMSRGPINRIVQIAHRRDPTSRVQMSRDRADRIDQTLLDPESLGRKLRGPRLRDPA